MENNTKNASRNLPRYLEDLSHAASYLGSAICCEISDYLEILQGAYEKAATLNGNEPMAKRLRAESRRLGDMRDILTQGGA